jgi:1-deoxy-D-xylulose-5-phosphate reductoisomerase
MMKKISILGSTGSIGRTSLDIINKKKNYFKIYLLSGHKNLNSIQQQIQKYKPEYFIISDN